MASMEWNNCHSVGVRQFDDEHKQLFDVANDLHKAISAGIDNTALILILDKADSIKAYHFKHEEDAFDATGYPNARTHRGLHKVARKMFASLRAEIVRAGSSHHAEELLLLLKGWFLLHIETEDKRYGDFLNSKGIR